MLRRQLLRGRRSVEGDLAFCCGKNDAPAPLGHYATVRSRTPSTSNSQQFCVVNLDLPASWPETRETPPAFSPGPRCSARAVFGQRFAVRGQHPREVHERGAASDGVSGAGEARRELELARSDGCSVALVVRCTLIHDVHLLPSDTSAS